MCFVRGQWVVVCSIICVVVVLCIGEDRCGCRLGLAEDDVDGAVGGVVEGEDVVLDVVLVDCDDDAGELDEADRMVEVVVWECGWLGVVGCGGEWE